MQSLHRKLDVVSVQILRYNCLETDYSFCEDSSPPAGLCPLPGCGFHPRTPLAPTIFFTLPPLLSTSDKNLVSFRPATPEFTRLKCVQ